MLSRLATIVQNAYVVDDLNAAMARWRSGFDVGPFFVGDVAAETVVLGVPHALEVKVGLTQCGPLQIELLQPLTHVPPLYDGEYGPGEHRMHHVSHLADDLDSLSSELVAAGIPEVCHNATGRRQNVFFDTRPLLGHFLEVIQRGRRIEDLYRTVREGAEGWDGVTDPIRPM